MSADPAWPRLIRGLRQAGTLPADWEPAFAAFPRSLFLPDRMWPMTDDGEYLSVDKDITPADWLRWAYADVPIVTQWDDGRHAGPGPGEEPTSSSSMPTMVAAMFADLDVADGMRLLEVGTGTGWCAALAAARLGETNVTSIEVDGRLAEAARNHLKSAGLHPQVITGDGAGGRPDGAPYDRVLATAAVRTVPAAWLAQTGPGGLIVVPWGTGYSQHDAIARLTVAADGTAGGPFTRGAGFMKLRAQRGAFPKHEDYLPGGEWPDDAREAETSLTLAELSGPAEFAIGLRTREIAHTLHAGADGTTTLLLYSTRPGDRSWAAVFFCDDGCTEFRVYSGGRRELWQEVEAAHRWWAEMGRPPAERFGLTVGPDGYQVWLDTADNPV
ncbi:MAG TPA: methyltransferase domain-containing protein [Streptosporangiaceae bacterium]|nr:methyltransferase domain-containing protein [Streptosporangiaceae bacterium]